MKKVSMKKGSKIIPSVLGTVCGGALIAWALPAAAMPYDFDNDNMNWSEGLVTLGSYGYESTSVHAAAAPWASEQGNGYIKTAATTALTPRAYNLGIFRTQSIPLLGDLTGQKVQVDFRRSGTFETLAGSAPTVRLVLSDATPDTTGFGQATWYYSSVQLAPKLNNIGTDWETYEYELDPSAFFVWPNGKGGATAGGTALPFEDMLKDYNYIGFTILSSAADNSAYGFNSEHKLVDYGAKSVGPAGAELHVDNLHSVPEPSTLALLGAVAVGWLATRWRKAPRWK